MDPNFGCDNNCKLTYRKVFITSIYFKLNDSNNLSLMDFMCTWLAHQAKLDNAYKAVVSKSENKKLFDEFFGNFINIKDEIIALENLSNLETPILYTEKGTITIDKYPIWIGTDGDELGTNETSCNFWTDIDSMKSAIVTYPNAFGHAWWNRSKRYCNDENVALLCVEIL